MTAELILCVFVKDLMTDLKDNLSHHFKEVMVGLMYPPASYDAHELWHALKVLAQLTATQTHSHCLYYLIHLIYLNV